MRIYFQRYQQDLEKARRDNVCLKDRYGFLPDCRGSSEVLACFYPLTGSAAVLLHDLWDIDRDSQMCRCFRLVGGAIRKISDT